MNSFGSEMKELAAKRKPIVERQQREAQARSKKEREERLKKEVTPQYNKIVAELPEKIRKAAHKGETSVGVLSEIYGGFSERENALALMLSKWAYENGFRTIWNSSPGFGSDGYPSEWFGIGWS